MLMHNTELGLLCGLKSTASTLEEKRDCENNVVVEDDIRKHMQKVADGFVPYDYKVIEGE